MLCNPACTIQVIGRTVRAWIICRHAFLCASLVYVWELRSSTDMRKKLGRSSPQRRGHCQSRRITRASRLLDVCGWTRLVVDVCARSALANDEIQPRKMDLKSSRIGDDRPCVCRAHSMQARARGGHCKPTPEDFSWLEIQSCQILDHWRYQSGAADDDDDTTMILLDGCASRQNPRALA